MDLSTLSESELKELLEHVQTEYNRRYGYGELYTNGLNYMNNYMKADIIRQNFNLAYDCFYKASQYGHIMSIYHLGWLHELAVELKISTNYTIKEHLSLASRYYAIASQYCPEAENAHKRIIARAINTLTGLDATPIQPPKSHDRTEEIYWFTDNHWKYD